MLSVYMGGGGGSVGEETLKFAALGDLYGTYFLSVIRRAYSNVGFQVM